LQSNPLFDEITALRKVNKELETKYMTELANVQQRDVEIQTLTQQVNCWKSK